MKKKSIISILLGIIILLFLLIAIFICKNNDTEKTTTQPSATETTTIHTRPEMDNISIPNTKKWQTEGLATLGLTDFKISEATDCLPGKVYIISKPDVGLFHNFYIALETPEKVWVTYSGTFLDTESESHYRYFLNDVDGEPGEELIVNADTGGNGGYGQYDSSVWKLSNNGVEKIFDACTIVGRFDTGFESQLKAPFKLVISNRYTGYETTIDYSENTEYKGTVFDKNGKPMSELFNRASFDSFYTFEPIDIDNDGVFEILCKQYTSLYSHADHIGDAQTILKYDKAEKDFKITDTEFILYTENEAN